ncbi:ABC transporter substrate-binding protein [Dactylosporangium sp. NPDC000555]|uniref:ABC transporter substrate-binding protein n=1 Tax=Dactylosporangium sp. NPDC000555 TaxID=3154260 RepID=UPI003320941E
MTVTRGWRRRTAGGLICLALVAGGAMGCGKGGADSTAGSTANCKSVDKVNYILAAASVTLGSVGYAQVPQELGFFAEECLDVTIQASGQTNSEIALAQMETGRFDVGVPATLSQVVFAGKKPVTKSVFFTAFTNIGLYVPDSGPVQSPADLAGKRMGVTSIGTGTAIYCLESARLDGVAANQIEQVPINSGLAAVAEALRSKKIDSWCGIDSDGIAFTNAGLPSHRLDTKFDKDLLPPGTLVATTKMLQERPDVLKRFLRALLKGYTFALAAPDKATAIALKLYPESKPAADNDQEAFKKALAIVEERMKNSRPPGYPQTSLGFTSDEALSRGIEPLKAAGLAPANITLDAWRDLSLLNDVAKDFDPKPIEELARTYKAPSF